MKKRTEFTVSSGNVFADVGLDNADELKAKADLAFEIIRILDERGLTQTKAAELLQVDQPKVSALRKGRLAGFSMERLYRFLGRLGQSVEIVVHTNKEQNLPRIKVVRASTGEIWRPPNRQKVAAKSARKTAAKKTSRPARKRA